MTNRWRNKLNDDPLPWLLESNTYTKLFNEQCEVARESGSEGEGNKVILKKEVSSTSLQNPSDPDATYGHKGTDIRDL